MKKLITLRIINLIFTYTIPNYTVYRLKNRVNAIIILFSYNFYNYYNKCILLGNISKLYNIQGTNIIKAITIGNNIVQQKDIN